MKKKINRLLNIEYKEDATLEINKKKYILYKMDPIKLADIRCSNTELIKNVIYKILKSSEYIKIIQVNRNVKHV